MEYAKLKTLFHCFLANHTCLLLRKRIFSDLVTTDLCARLVVGVGAEAVAGTGYNAR